MRPIFPPPAPPPPPSACFWCYDMETCLFVFLILSVDHIVVDTDDPFVKVAVFPAQTNGFTDTVLSRILSGPKPSHIQSN